MSYRDTVARYVQTQPYRLVSGHITRLKGGRLRCHSPAPEPAISSPSWPRPLVAASRPSRIRPGVRRSFVPVLAVFTCEVAKLDGGNGVRPHPLTAQGNPPPRPETYMLSLRGRTGMAPSEARWRALGRHEPAASRAPRQAVRWAWRRVAVDRGYPPPSDRDGRREAGGGRKTRASTASATQPARHFCPPFLN